MSSGVAVRDECIQKYQELKLGKKIKYIIYEIKPPNTEIGVEKAKDATSYDEFLQELPPTECRYAVYDFEWEQGGGEGKRNKICFITWSPDDARIKNKMLYAASKEALRKSLVGIGAEVQATDLAEAGYDAVLEKCTRR